MNRDTDLAAKIHTLPKWAQQHLHHLEIELAAARRSLAEVPKTNTLWGWADNTKLGGACQYIPDDEAVRFMLDNEHHRWLSVRRELDKPYRLLLYGSHPLVLGMKSSNMALLEVDRKGDW